ncbi:MAG: C10 family peptidase [Bacteroidetes bacterium]|nr:C10 family peptidase [Bacteroidota bacterium]
MKFNYQGMKRVYLAFLGVLLFIGSFAKHVPVNVAKQVANNHAQQNMQAAAATAIQFELVHTEIIGERPTNASYKNLQSVSAYYVFNVSNGDGFVMVSGDDLLTPILAYSNSSDFSLENQPKAMVKMLAGYTKALRERISTNAQQEDFLAEAWQEYISGNFKAYKTKKAVAPLMKTTWNQAPYYNDLCPYDNAQRGRSVTGCVATAMAQVMKYWEFPSKGIGYHSYNHPRLGTLSANFGNTEYKWSQMPNSINGSNSAIATLMYHCGVAVDMNYSANSSGAYVIKDDANICAEAALEDFFGYKTSLEGVSRYNYTNSEWVNLMKKEMDAKRPVIYAGFGSGGGHAFVCDGYDNRSYFHMNWGWGGYQDGYFALDALNPQGTGTGGGTGGYNSNQQAIIGIEAPSGNNNNNPTEYDIRMYSSITVDVSQVVFLDGFTLKADVANFGDNDFTGDFAAAIFDQNDQFVEFIAQFQNETLPTQTHFTNGLSFKTDGLKAPPGVYKVGILYKPKNGNWTLADDGQYDNYVDMKIWGFDNDIQLYRDIEVDPTQIVINESFDVWFDIANTDWFEYSGKLSADLHNTEGEHVVNIGEMDIDGFCANCHYTDGLTISSNGVDIEPGTYYLVIWELGDNESDWEIVGSNDKPNPIYVVVSEPGEEPDNYEDNNNENTAYLLNASFTNNKAKIKTAGTNIHKEDDYDYFKINFEDGFRYTITARVHDIYDATDGKEYTTDVLFTYDDGSGWSESYDEKMSSNATISGAGTFRLFVAPYFQGEMGTYSLEINITREIISSTAVPEFDLTIFPNPASDKVTISATNEFENGTIQLISANGQIVKSQTNISGNSCQIETAELPAGVYQLQILSSGTIYREKLIIKR